MREQYNWLEGDSQQDISPVKWQGCSQYKHLTPSFAIIALLQFCESSIDSYGSVGLTTGRWDDLSNQPILFLIYTLIMFWREHKINKNSTE